MKPDLSSSSFAFLASQMEQGNVVLFCGAGFSVDATNRKGDSPPLGRNLAADLAEFAGQPFNDESLPLVYKVVQRTVGATLLNEHLESLYKITGFKDWYKSITSLIWHRVNTTNIDNLLEKTYSGQSLQSTDVIVCPSPPKERDPHYSPVQLVHLHGHIEQLSKGLVFSLQEFAGQQVLPNPWYQILADDLFYRPVIFVGTFLEESTFHYYLSLRDQKQSGVKEFLTEVISRKPIDWPDTGQST